MKTAFARIVAAVLSFAVASVAARVGGHRKPPNVGTTMFDRRDLNREWTPRNAGMLSGRMIVDQLLPRRVPDGAAFLRYWELIAEKLTAVGNEALREVVAGMVADAVGGYLHVALWPRVKASYYEGHGTHDVAERLHGLLRKIKFCLGTDGHGWATPTEVPFASSAAADEDKGEDAGADEDGACDGLLLTAAKRVLIPAFDDDVHPGSVAVPFASGQRLFGLRKPWTYRDAGRNLSLLSRYYRMAVRCTANDPHRFRREIDRWLNNTVRPLLTGSRRWYPALSGAARVIRFAAAAAANDDSRRSKRMAEEEHPSLPVEPEVDCPSRDKQGELDRQLLLSKIFSIYVLVVFAGLIAACLMIAGSTALDYLIRALTR